MATLDDILTTQKNGVVAINNLNQSLSSFYEYYKLVAGTETSSTVSSPATLVSGAGRLISYTTAITAGSTAGVMYDEITYTVLSISGSGTSATVTYNGTNAFSIGDTVYINGCLPSGYDTAAGVVVGATTNTVTYTNTTTAPITVGGIIMNKRASRVLSSISGSLGTYPIGVKFYRGITVIPATGQSVNISYSLS